MNADTHAVVVVGAGAGGLACAIDLAASGVQVTLVERAATTGGKVRSLEVGGLQVDAGPTVLTMRWVFDELFARAGRSLDDYVFLEPAEILARHAWQDGSRLDLFAEEARSVDAIARLSGRDEAERYRQFCRYARKIFEAVEGPFIRAQRPGVGTMLRLASRSGFGAIARVDAHRTMWRALEAAFQDQRLRQLFGRYATYCGCSPFSAPATLNVIAHVESLGVHRVRGGMLALAKGLEKLARELGVTIRNGSEVTQVVVRGGRATGVVLETGEKLEADAVVSNADVSAIGSGLLGTAAACAAPPTSARARSFSAVTWVLAVRARGFPLVHHNVFFSPDPVAEFEALTGDKRVPDEPTIYVCALDRRDEPIAPATERLLVIANAPATGDDPSSWNDEVRLRCERTLWSMMDRFGLELAPREGIQTTPLEFDRLFPGTGGALYGPMMKGSFSALLRQGSRTRIDRLYMVGGSVHPGPGVPMAAMSGRLAADSLREDLASTGGSPRVATSGSTSTA